MLRRNWIFRYCLSEIHAAGRHLMLKIFQTLYSFQSLSLKEMLLRFKSNFNSQPPPRIFYPYLLLLFCACNTPYEAQLFLRHPLGCDWGGGVWGGCGIVTAECNCRPFAIVVPILATVAAYLHPLP